VSNPPPEPPPPPTTRYSTDVTPDGAVHDVVPTVVNMVLVTEEGDIEFDATEDTEFPAVFVATTVKV
jgi:hypothetical protein